MRADVRALSRLQALALGGSGLLLLLTATMALGPLMGGSGWWWLCAVTSTAVLLSAAGFRALRVTPSLVPVLSLIVLLVLLTLVFGGATSLLGLIPTPATFTEFGSLLTEGRASIEQQSVPAVTVPGILFVLGLGTGLMAAVVDILVVTLRAPAIAAAPALVPIVISGLIVNDGAEVGTLLLTGAAYLLLLRVDVRVRRSAELAAPDEGDLAARVVNAPRVTGASTVGATLGLAGVGLLAASVLAAATPSVSTSYLFGTGERGDLFTRGVSPFVDLGQDLRRPEAVPALHYTTASGQRPYFTLLTLDTIEGQTWTSAPSGFDSDNTVDEFPRPPGLAATVPTTENEVTIFVDGVYTPWLPLPYPTSRVAGVDGEWYWDESTHNVSSPDGTTRGERYRALSVEVEPTPDQLRQASIAVPESMAPYLTLPGDVPEIITRTAAEQTAGAGSPYDAAVLLQRYLRSVEFGYSTEAPVAEGYDGGGVDVIAEFLEKKTGYCVHFSSAMAIMARELGIPSRISLGYTAGRTSDMEIDGLTRYNVSSSDLHSWPELYFDGLGWLPFEPTPGRGSIPQYSREAVLDDPDSLTEATTAPNSPTETRGGMTLDDDAGGAGGLGGDDFSVLIRTALIALAALALLSIPALLRAVLRWRRRIAARGRDRPAHAAWREVAATGGDHGVTARLTETPRRYAERIGELAGFRDDRAANSLGRLLEAIEAERYGRPGGSGPPGADLAADLDRVIAAAAVDQPLPLRLRARLLPLSLLGLLPALRGGYVAPGA
jgi:transglutaminase-like putative cysteine protease